MHTKKGAKTPFYSYPQLCTNLFTTLTFSNDLFLVQQKNVAIQSNNHAFCYY
ncbi:hypothetical protein FC07_GL001300 [Loigolactobacillus bifermentans DSM 20003]|uniref:Uncharacterized protein n=1 Tax=Loigolactobacillus bifermentans DSM 20003 TaxID=1423726 RepID=A0A0R1GH69_9LACO|nr:hypothetical protein FC07_GL001300 [Loigolactobacillus bifermentans DSM 20003]